MTAAMTLIVFSVIGDCRVREVALSTPGITATVPELRRNGLYGLARVGEGA